MVLVNATTEQLGHCSGFSNIEIGTDVDTTDLKYAWRETRHLPTRKDQVNRPFLPKQEILAPCRSNIKPDKRLRQCGLDENHN